MTSSMRVLFVHAHPDDESVFTGGTIAHLVASGARVHVVTCTAGEMGEVYEPNLSSLLAPPQGIGTLGAYRVVELTAALAHLGATGEFLGGCHYWHDSGMQWDGHGRACAAAECSPMAFSLGNTSEEHAKQQQKQLRDCVLRFRPHLIITYGETGGYGHPDHVRAHNLCREILPQLDPDDAPAVWESVLAPDLYRANARVRELPSGWSFPTHDLAKNTSAEYYVPVEAYLGIVRAALRAHRSQLRVMDNADVFAMTNREALGIAYTEYYRSLFQPSGGQPLWERYFSR